MTSENISDFDPPVSNGSLFIRVTDTSTGEVTRHQIDIDPSTDLSVVATAISGITGLNSTVLGSRLSIQADTGYKFDFMPAVLSEPTASTFTAGSPPAVSVSGIYTGSENQTFTFTAVGTGSVGNGTLQLEVRDGAGQLVGMPLNIGAGYAAGDRLDFGNGIKIAIGAGNLNADDSFAVDAYANTDTSGLLSAVGINTFFAGDNASDMAISSDVADTPGRIATAIGSDLTDNTNAKRLASVGETEISGLNSLTAGQFYRQLVSGIGQQLSVKKTSQSNTETLVQSLVGQQSNISGVDTNDEAAQMLVFEQMFQAMAKYLSTVNTTLASIMNIL
jgi:flagellar hook-associated protein 1 FlgK